MPKTVVAAAAAVALGHAAAQPLPSVSITTTYHRVVIDGVGVFYREAGPRDAPTVLLLHGYPSSSRQWDPLLPLLADRYHLVAPDYPGFGQSDAPSPAHYSYTFDNLAATMEGLVSHLGIGRYTLFMQDYGGPVGFRMAKAHPEQLTALIIQNANAYAEGLGVKWQGIAKYWADPAAHPEQLDAFTSLEGLVVLTRQSPALGERPLEEGAMSFERPPWARKSRRSMTRKVRLRAGLNEGEWTDLGRVRRFGGSRPLQKFYGQPDLEIGKISASSNP